MHLDTLEDEKLEGAAEMGEAQAAGTHPATNRN
jgi:hypothetical protein